MQKKHLRNSIESARSEHKNDLFVFIRLSPPNPATFASGIASPNDSLFLSSSGMPNNRSSSTSSKDRSCGAIFETDGF